MAFYQFHCPTRIIFDEGISRDFAHECGILRIKKPFVITDKALRELGLCDPILESLKGAGMAIAGLFDEVPPDSSVTAIETCAARAKKTDADSFLAIGGGSVMDTAKGANILFTLGGDLREDYSGAQTIPRALAPLIAVPTTAGTGSEVSGAIVVYDEQQKTKLSFVDHHLLPTLAVLDPELTEKLPPKLTAATGLDALTHAMEAVMSVQRGPVSDGLAFQAISLIHRFLLRAVREGTDLKARSGMMSAANLAGLAFNHAMVGVVHAVSHSVGAVARVHHGTANGIFLPYGLEYNREAVPDRIATMAPCFGLAPSGDEEELVDEVIGAVKNLVKDLCETSGLPMTYKDAGLKEEQIEKVAELASEDGASFYNPRAVEAEALLPFLRRAYSGHTRL